MPELMGSRDYTPAEDIRDVLQVLMLVKARPALKLSGENRGTAIGYAELQRMVKRLNDALAKIEAKSDASGVGHDDDRNRGL